jgi:hypothetical protein
LVLKVQGVKKRKVSDKRKVEMGTAEVDAETTKNLVRSVPRKVQNAAEAQGILCKKNSSAAC